MSAPELTLNLPESPRRSRPRGDVAVAMIPAWRRRPTGGPRIAALSVEELNTKIDEYFDTTYEMGLKPTLHDLAGIAGFNSVAHMLNHIRRTPTIASGLSRAMLAIGAEYEDLLQTGVRTAQWMLERIPNFDPDNKRASPPQLPFHLKQELQLSGTITHEPGRQLSEQEAYMQLIKCKTYEELEETVELQLDDDGIYSLLELPDES